MGTDVDGILMIKQAIFLLIIGMGIAFVFMYALVWVMRGVAKIVPRFNHLLPEKERK